jgi:hypothetical protein
VWITTPGIMSTWSTTTTRANLRILLLFPCMVTLFGQTEQNAVPNPGAAIANALRGTGTSTLGLAFSALPFLPNQPPSPSNAALKCAVPLREMTIPDDKNFTVKELKPPRDFTDHMATAQALPACPIAAK